jgi:hypothetical protein
MPRREKNVKSLLGFANYLQDYILFYTNIVVPLEKLWKKKWISSSNWTKEYEKALQ